jgi:hypothetical protein
MAVFWTCLRLVLLEPPHQQFRGRNEIKWEEPATGAGSTASSVTTISHVRIVRSEAANAL